MALNEFPGPIAPAVRQGGHRQASAPTLQIGDHLGDVAVALIGVIGPCFGDDGGQFALRGAAEDGGKGLAQGVDVVGNGRTFAGNALGTSKGMGQRA